MNETILIGADVHKNGIRYFKSDHVPYLMDPLEALKDDNIKTIKIYKPVSQGCTVSIIENAIFEINKKINTVNMDLAIGRNELIDHSVFNNAVMKSRQCGLMGTAGLRFLMGIQEERFMLSDIEEKRTPDYVKKSLEELRI